MPANHFVARASLASSVFDLFFDKKVSELPLRAPERPEVFPDWSTTIAIIATQITRWTIATTVLIVSTQFNPFEIQYSAFITNCDNNTFMIYMQEFFANFVVRKF